jgi:hypothetical protein
MNEKLGAEIMRFTSEPRDVKVLGISVNRQTVVKYILAILTSLFTGLWRMTMTSEGVNPNS